MVHQGEGCRGAVPGSVGSEQGPPGGIAESHEGTPHEVAIAVRRWLREPLAQGAREGRGQGPGSRARLGQGREPLLEARGQAGRGRGAQLHAGEEQREDQARGAELPDDPARRIRGEEGRHQRGGRGAEHEARVRGALESKVQQHRERCDRDHPGAEAVAGREGAALAPAARRQEGQDGSDDDGRAQRPPQALGRPEAQAERARSRQVARQDAARIEDQGEGGPDREPQESAGSAIDPCPGCAGAVARGRTVHSAAEACEWEQQRERMHQQAEPAGHAQLQPGPRVPRAPAQRCVEGGEHEQDQQRLAAPARRREREARQGVQGQPGPGRAARRDPCRGGHAREGERPQRGRHESGGAEDEAPERTAVGPGCEHARRRVPREGPDAPARVGPDDGLLRSQRPERGHDALDQGGHEDGDEEGLHLRKTPRGAGRRRGSRLGGAQLKSVPVFPSSCSFRRFITFVWIWQTRLSVSDSISPISRIVCPTR